MEGRGPENFVGKFFEADKREEEKAEGGGKREKTAERRLERWLPTESAPEFVFRDGETSSSSRMSRYALVQLSVSRTR